MSTPSKRKAEVPAEGTPGKQAAPKASPAGKAGGSEGGWKCIHWNVNGMRAMLKKNTKELEEMMAKEKPDVLILTETKIDDSITKQFEKLFPGYTAVFNCSQVKKGYSGTALFSKVKPLSVSLGLGIPEHDGEGRVITAEYEDLYLVGAYVPNSGQKLERLEYRTTQWDPSMLAHLKELDAKKPVVWTGDLNVAHGEIDLFNPKGNKNKTAGFCDGERNNFSKVLSEGFVDAWRERNPEGVLYTYWSIRANCRPQNKGWRLDYFVVSERLMERVKELPVFTDVPGSDHCPVGIV
eukprot:CAMPEP_0182910476 /NCGR_PEP_ID=MMETSP0034_2-20130328/36344_1 /TAXON_ID=156128 /ORGANISM="Nephroselmis pyriformis, Strain CCMP717" /LENGTH=293 /DNA_ID=CAMNT_0025046839 /DNA_START=43 /DNA_END=921 /DNA_ORIENTATION=-